MTIDRRTMLRGATAAAGGRALGGCDQLAQTKWFSRTLKAGEDANLFVQRLMLTDTALARECSRAEISPWFKPNGTVDPIDAPYKALAANSFADFRLEAAIWWRSRCCSRSTSFASTFPHVMRPMRSTSLGDGAQMARRRGM